MGLLALTATVSVITKIDTPSAYAQTPDPSQVSIETTTLDSTAPAESSPQDTPSPDAADNQVDLGTFVTTSYSLSGTMRDGEWTHYGAVAVDPSVIPLGSTLYIEDLGYFVAEDTGGGIHGSQIDIWLPSRYQAVSYGLQYRQAWLLP